MEQGYRESLNRYERDSRTFLSKTGDFLAMRSTGTAVIFGLAALSVLSPSFSDLSLLFGLAFFPYYALKKESLPIRLPVSARRIDPNDPLPGNRSAFSRARGIFYLGRERRTLAECWLTKSDITRHLLVLGTTGSGKTEFLLALAANALAMGAGLIYVDAKGATDVFWRIYGLAKRFGREDDVLLLNFITGNRRQDNPTEKVSNTNNIFATGSAEALTQIIVGLLSGSDEGENAIFRDRAISLMGAIMRCLVDLRDAGKLPLSIRILSDWVSNMEFLLDVMRGRFSGQPFEFSLNARAAMTTYLNALGGADPKKPANQQSESVLKQHGFAQAYWTKVLSDLSFTYGHIFGGGLGEIDWQDVVANRRICFVNMPSMEKPPAELQSLGRVILSGIRNAMSVSLGSGVEGERSQVLDSKPSVSKAPTFVILDEYGYIATEGFAVAAAQARSLGFSITFAGQDWAGFTRGSETEAEQIKGNTFVKLLMNVQDEKETWEIFRVAAGQEVVTRLSSIDPPAKNNSTRFSDGSVSVELRDKLAIQDAREQIEGEAIALFGDRTIRLSLPFVPPGGLSVDRLALNRFLPVFPPGMLDPEDMAPVAPESPLERYLKAKDPIPEKLSGHVPDFRLLKAEEILSKSSEPLHLRSIRAFFSLIGKGKDEGDTDKLSTPVGTGSPSLPSSSEDAGFIPENVQKTTDVQTKDSVADRVETKRQEPSPPEGLERTRENPIPSPQPVHLHSSEPVEVSEEKYLEDLVSNVFEAASKGEEDKG
jgi:intracellular multiplication protein IcmO